MNRKKIYNYAFYVSGNASRLIKIIYDAPEIIKSTHLVVNDNKPNFELASLLKERGIDYYEFNYGDLGLKGNNANNYVSELLLSMLIEYNIDYVFCFGGRILRGDLLNKFKNKIINFHPSILPSFPGINSIDQALSANSFLIGNTSHFIDEGVDTGPVIMQCVLQSSSYNDYEDILGLQIKMIKQIFIWLNQDQIIVEQNKVRVLGANYGESVFFPKLDCDLNTNL